MSDLNYALKRTVSAVHKISASVALALATTDGKSVWHFRAC